MKAPTKAKLAVKIHKKQNPLKMQPANPKDVAKSYANCVAQVLCKAERGRGRGRGNTSALP